MPYIALLLISLYFGFKTQTIGLTFEKNFLYTVI